MLDRREIELIKSETPVFDHNVMFYEIEKMTP
jgi:hypothetical protein